MIARLTSMNAETLLLKMLEMMKMMEVLTNQHSMDVGLIHMEEELDKLLLVALLVSKKKTYSVIHHVHQDIQEMLTYVGRIALLVSTIHPSLAQRLKIMEEV